MVVASCGEDKQRLVEEMADLIYHLWVLLASKEIPLSDVEQERGIAVRGLLVRHLVLPNGLAGTERIARFLADEVSKDTYINVMDQYRPAHRAELRLQLSERLTTEEYDEAVAEVRAAGLWRLEGQQGGPSRGQRRA